MTNFDRITKIRLKNQKNHLKAAINTYNTFIFKGENNGY